jgi:hypothetical protein
MTLDSRGGVLWLTVGTRLNIRFEVDAKVWFCTCGDQLRHTERTDDIKLPPPLRSILSEMAIFRQPAH